MSLSTNCDCEEVALPRGEAETDGGGRRKIGQSAPKGKHDRNTGVHDDASRLGESRARGCRADGMFGG
jgi:hypothetical protein